MEPRLVYIGSRKMSIRLMDWSYLTGEDEAKYGIALDIECRRLCPSWPNPLYSAYCRKLLEAYGIGAVLVWEANRVVGFLPMTAVGCGIPELLHCVHLPAAWHTERKGI